MLAVIIILSVVIVLLIAITILGNRYMSNLHIKINNIENELKTIEHEGIIKEIVHDIIRINDNEEVFLKNIAEINAKLTELEAIVKQPKN